MLSNQRCHVERQQMAIAISWYVFGMQNIFIAYIRAKLPCKFFKRLSFVFAGAFDFHGGNVVSPLQQWSCDEKIDLHPVSMVTLPWCRIEIPYLHTNVNGPTTIFGGIWKCANYHFRRSLETRRPPLSAEFKNTGIATFGGVWKFSTLHFRRTSCKS